MKTYQELFEAYQSATREFDFANQNYRLARLLPELQGKLPGLRDQLALIGRRMDDAQMEFEAYCQRERAAVGDRVTN